VSDYKPPKPVSDNQILLSVVALAAVCMLPLVITKPTPNTTPHMALTSPFETAAWTTHVAGLPHHKPNGLPAVGDEVNLEPEPTNPHDPNAIKVLWKTQFIGYIPKDFTSFIRSQNLTVLHIVDVDMKRRWKEIKLSTKIEPSVPAPLVD